MTVGQPGPRLRRSVGSRGRRSQRGWVLAAWDDVSRRAGRGGLGQCVLVWAGVG